jgi:hypothetical protein
MSFTGFMFFLYSLYLIFKEKQNKRFILAFAMIGFSLLIFTFFIGNKNIRYIMPVMPFIAVIMGYGLDLILKKTDTYKIGGILAPFFIAFTIISYFILSFGIPVYPQYKHALDFPLLGWTDIYYWHTDPVKGIYDTTDWSNKEIASIFINEAHKQNTTLYYFIDPELPYLNASTLHANIYSLLKSVPKNMQELDTNFPFVLQGAISFKDDASLASYINKADIVVIVKKDIGSKNDVRDYDVRNQIKEYFNSGKAYNFSVIKKITLPNNDTAFIYKKGLSDEYHEYHSYQ